MPPPAGTPSVSHESNSFSSSHQKAVQHFCVPGRGNYPQLHGAKADHIALGYGNVNMEPVGPVLVFADAREERRVVVHLPYHRPRRRLFEDFFAYTLPATRASGHASCTYALPEA